MKIKKSFFLNLDLAVVLIVFTVSIVFTAYQNFTRDHYRHFSQLGYALWQGRTNITDHPEKLLDTMLGRGDKYYSFLDPLPGVLMMPFSLIGGNRVSQGYLDLLVTLVSLYLLNKLLSQNEVFRKVTLRLWFLVIFFFASNMVSVIFLPHTWFLAENIGIMWTLFFILEWRGKRRGWLIFLLMLFLTLTKKNMAFPVVGFIITDFLIANKKKADFLKIGLCGLGAVLGAVIIWRYQLIAMKPADLSHYYDFARIEEPVKERIRKYGIWNIVFIPTNVVNFFIAGPEIIKENPLDYYSFLAKPYFYPPLSGISFFYLSPIFLSILLLPFGQKKKIIPPVVAFFIWAGVYLTYHASGAAQFGARYVSEAMPFLFLLLLEVLPKHFGLRARMIVVMSVIFNVFMLLNFTSRYLNP